MRIVVDTNVIASAIFFGGKPYQLLHYIMEGRVDVVTIRIPQLSAFIMEIGQSYMNAEAPVFSARGMRTLSEIEANTRGVIARPMPLAVPYNRQA